jgi:hypothetical protein
MRNIQFLQNIKFRPPTGGLLFSLNFWSIKWKTKLLQNVTMISEPKALKPQLILMFIPSLATMNISRFNPRA